MTMYFFYYAKYGAISGYVSGTGIAKNRYGSTTLLGRLPLVYNGALKK
jgi:hypothetical protein